MIRLRHSAIRVDHQSHGVFVNASVPEGGISLQFPEKCRITNDGTDKIVVPLEQVVYRGKESTCPVDDDDRHIDEGNPLTVRITQRAILDDPPDVLLPGRASHPERLKDTAGCEVGKRHPAHTRNDDPGKMVAGVAVRPARARRKVQ